MDPKKKKTLNNAHQAFMDLMLKDFPLERMPEYIAGDVMGYGTTLHEKLFGMEALADLIRLQREQGQGLQMSWEIDPVLRWVADHENNAVFVDEVKLLMTLEDREIQLNLRLTLVFDYLHGSWKIIHWHGSKPEYDEGGTDTWHLDEWKKKNEELQRLVDEKTADLERKNRDLEIEAALERVRAVAMGMREPSDMPEVCKTITGQLQSLGVKEIRNVQTAIFNEQRSTYMNYKYYAKHDKPIITETEYNNNKTHKAFALKMLKGKGEVFITHIKGKKVKDWIAYQKTTNVFIDKYLETALSLNYYWFSLGLVALGISTYKPLSKDEINLFKRFLRVFELAYQRYLDIARAGAQAREAQIEAALERVRTRTMGMQKSEELKDVIQVVYEQFVHLGIHAEHTGFITDYKERDDYKSWIADRFGSPSQVTIPYFDCTYYNRFNEAKKNGTNFFAITLSLEEKNRFYKDLFKHVSGFPDESKKIIFNHPGFTISTVLLENVALYIENFTGIPFSEEVDSILMRFGNVFQQTYTRFLDLQKAEAQAKEAQIELSLERIRSQVTAMQESYELLDIVVMMQAEFNKLGHEAHYFWHMRWMPDKYEKALTNGDGTRIGNVLELPRGFHGLQSMLEWEKSDEPSGVFALDPDTAADYIDKMITLGRFQEIDHSAPGPDDVRAMGGLTFVMARTTHGEIGYTLPGEVPDPPEEDITTLVRFAGVFDLAYRRFEDLKEAERRNRETQIELSLERTRSRSMLMHHSSELNEISKIFHEQLLLLGIDSEFSFVWLPDEDNQKHMFWATWATEENGDVQYHSKAINYPLDKTEPGTAACYVAWGSGQAVHETYVPPAEIVTFFTSWEELLRGADHFKPELFPEGIFYTEAYMKYGCFGIDIRRKLTDDEKEIIRRFAVEFERTYTRFLDLQKSEAQAKEARIEAALEKVRSRTLAMQKSDELAETAAVLFQQLMGLGIAPNRLYIAIIKDESGDLEFWITDEDGSKVSRKFTGNVNGNASVKKMYAGWKEKKKSISIDMKGKELESYFHYLSDELNVPFQGGQSQKRRVQHLAYFSEGFIGIASPDNQPEETIKLLERFAGVFNLTFTRFNDLKIAEAHAQQAEQDLIEIKAAKQKAEEALTELQTTQKQLIQSEKMASLGELTAGIAHEIQNPLNFVNNFSEVSNELIDEMREELDNGFIAEAKAIVSDIKANLEKIHQHGKRADSIVKGMLQHSRTSTGQKELTDINALADEYLRLSYHGFRAKDKSFNADFKTHLDPNLLKTNVVPQDMGRVLLNLINNAFYAVNEKLKSGIKDYKPLVVVKTEQQDGKIEISITDNGNGIPDPVKEKIFQPFFTTKPTGEGTGLGLSLSYDIITKGHNGELKVETKLGEGSEFITSIPLNP